MTRGVAVVAEIENAGGSARFVGADLGQPAEALRLAEEAGDVDILVNNAGFPWFGPSEELPVDTLVRLFAANVQAPYLLVSVLAPKMVARGHNVIINVASRAGTRGRPDSAAYGATKAALTSFARSWAAESDPPGSASTPSHQDPSTPTRPNGNCSMSGARPHRSVGLASRKRSPRLSDFWLPPARVHHRHQRGRRRRQRRRLTPPQTDTTS